MRNLAILGFAAAAVIVVILLIALSGGGSDPDSDTVAQSDEPTSTATASVAATATSIRPTATPMAATATVQAPTATPMAATATIQAPTATPVPATATVPAPTATPAPLAPSPTPAGPPPPTPTTAPTAQDESESERQYRVRADSQLLSKTAAVNGANANASTVGTLLAVKNMGQLGGAFANQLRAWEPVPPRFLEAHEGLIAALVAFQAYSITIDSITTSGVIDSDAFGAWADGFNLTIENVNIAISFFNFTVGTSVPLLN